MKTNNAEGPYPEPLTRAALATMVKEFDHHGRCKTAEQIQEDLRVNKRWLIQLLAKYARHMGLDDIAFMEELKQSSMLEHRFRCAVIRYVRRFGIPEVPKLTVDDIANENWIDVARWSDGRGA